MQLEQRLASGNDIAGHHIRDRRDVSGNRGGQTGLLRTKTNDSFRSRDATQETSRLSPRFIDRSGTKFVRKNFQPHELKQPYLRNKVAEAERCIAEFRKKHPRLPAYLGD
jgi:hypothetical protein